MAELELTKVWIHRADDLSVYETFFSDRPGEKFAQDGDVRAYANGRLRIITRALRRTSLPVVLRDVTDAQVATLKSWAGDLLLYRDPRGRLLFGTFLELDRREYKAVEGNDVAFTFLEATHTAEV